MKRPFSSTRMKWIIFLLIIFTLQQSCTNDKNSSKVIIKKSQETISTTDTITVKLFVDYYGNRLPEFYIFGKDSTKYYLPFDEKNELCHI